MRPPLFELWFYRARFGTWQDKFASWWTVGPYSHVELVFPDGRCFSSSPRDDGVRVTRIPPSDHWAVVKLPQMPTSPAGALAVSQECAKFIGRGYDWLGCVGCWAGVSSVNDGNRWYCSEIAIHVINRFAVGPAIPERLTPNRLFDHLVTAGLCDSNPSASTCATRD